MPEGAFVGKIPLFAGALAFLNACGDGGSEQTTGSTSTDTSGTGQESTTTETGPVDSSTSSSTGDASSDTGEPQCVTCSAEPPEGWFGPVAYARVTPGDAAPECPDSIPDKGPTVLEGLNPPAPASCECSCQLQAGGGNNCYVFVVTGEPGGYSSSGYSDVGGFIGYSDVGGFIGYSDVGGYYGTSYGGTGVVVSTTGFYGGTSGGYVGTGYAESGYIGTGYAESGYIGTGYAESGYGGTDGYDCGGQFFELNTAGCTNMNVDGQIRLDVWADYGYGASCMKTSSETIPPVSWTAEIATCRLPTVTPMCDGGEICLPPLPEGFESKWCLYKDNDVDCPAGPYSKKTVFWTDVDDTRTCSTCACGTPGAASCEDTEVFVYEDLDCAGEPIASVPATGQCVEATGQSVAPSSAAEPQCPVTQASEPEGDVTPTGAFTFCCTE